MITLQIEMPRRRADAYINSAQDAKKLGVKVCTTQPCHVLGLFQTASEYESSPAFVCEFNDGTVLMLFVEYIRFLDTDKNGVIK